jgi:uncharacterized membrane protein
MMARARSKGKRNPDRQTTEKNIESILKLEQEDERELSAFHRVSHAVGRFVGTIYFVLIQCIFVLLWIGLNTHLFGNAPAFDPYPFPLLSTVLALEAVLLTSFVLSARMQWTCGPSAATTSIFRSTCWPKRKRPAF